MIVCLSKIQSALSLCDITIEIGLVYIYYFYARNMKQIYYMFSFICLSVYKLLLWKC